MPTIEKNKWLNDEQLTSFDKICEILSRDENHILIYDDKIKGWTLKYSSKSLARTDSKFEKFRTSLMIEGIIMQITAKTFDIESIVYR